jgi:hypothetical protein
VKAWNGTPGDALGAPDLFFPFFEKAKANRLLLSFKFINLFGFG